MSGRGKFATALERGDVVAALMAAPFGYRSQYIGGRFENGFRFTIDDGRTAEAPTLLDAVRAALAVSVSPSENRNDEGSAP